MKTLSLPRFPRAAALPRQTEAGLLARSDAAPAGVTAYVSTFPTPLGPFSVAVDETGAVVASAFGNDKALRSRLTHHGREVDLRPDEARTAAARSQIREYLSGTRREFDLRTAPAGTAFQRRVWAELQRVPFGETRSYAQIARVVRSSPRAVGRANATNPICVVVPCHRIIGADGALTGFAFGEPLKRHLLELERATAGKFGP